MGLLVVTTVLQAVLVQPTQQTLGNGSQLGSVRLIGWRINLQCVRQRQETEATREAELTYET